MCVRDDKLDCNSAGQDLFCISLIEPRIQIRTIDASIINI